MGNRSKDGKVKNQARPQHAEQSAGYGERRIEFLGARPSVASTSCARLFLIGPIVGIESCFAGSGGGGAVDFDGSLTQVDQRTFRRRGLTLMTSVDIDHDTGSGANGVSYL
ncbi:hypothetical protein NDU88_001208 [Pleurodeles waltl]|uniref:Uncharacterized protein n=1 Tax=Pleurodeles waltl TaxID=8319 RepID=A0AAV7R6D8_PLEWA|nr:hypothetical protein NDU88_001208 [Pleurodeles waltl]